jgi:hypothetical protein
VCLAVSTRASKALGLSFPAWGRDSPTPITAVDAAG